MGNVDHDTIELLKECNAGVKMGVDSIADVMDHVQSPDLREILNSSKEDHQKIGSETREMLQKHDESGKEPNPMAKSMSWLKTNMKITLDESDATVADLITDGCNMGIKSMNRYLNQYAAAEEKAKDIAKELINLEKKTALDLSAYL